MYPIHNHPVIKQYYVLDECLHLVTESKMNVVRKLRVEAKLIRLKTLLFGDAVPQDAHSDGAADLFEELFCQVRQMSDGSSDERGFDEFMERVVRLLVTLGDDPARH